MVREPEHQDQLQSMVFAFFKQYKIARLLKQSNITKQAGIAVLDSFRVIFSLVFTQRSLNRWLKQSGDKSFGKDTVYRFLNSPRHNWRRFLLLLSAAVVQQLSQLTSDDRADVFIVDDSLFSRSRSKKVELLARVYDHVSHKFVRGFRMLTLGWSDGNSFVPLAFSLLSSENERNRLCDVEDSIDKRTCGYKRRKESMQKATDALFELLTQAQAMGITAKYLLFDSWFAYPAVILKALEHSMHVVCMLKAVPKVRYEYKGRRLTLKELYSALRKRRGRAKILASVIVAIGQDENGNPIPVKIVFVRDRNRSRQWLALLSTDTSLSDDEVIRIYGKRWDIECFFKVSKSNLRLAKELQGRTYDQMFAHTTIVFTRYIMLATAARDEQDPRTIGALFFDCCDELDDIRFADAMRLLIELLRSIMKTADVQNDNVIDMIVKQFITHLPSSIKEKLVA
ncbi:IS4 family transposase [Alicyclobacillus sp. ALC3]|uniref:IS4 family transposase n=1 Tax=Alicyclobacillus sp. ALC3 TaxID=2796143 RepID=UPI0023794E3C|nr:transposase [Alicyclobacillus sp. ALC3]WDL96765.1 transposase [Alicyclobacillus sp. ALC3]